MGVERGRRRFGSVQVAIAKGEARFPASCKSPAFNPTSNRRNHVPLRRIFSQKKLTSLVNLIDPPRERRSKSAHAVASRAGEGCSCAGSNWAGWEWRGGAQQRRSNQQQHTRTPIISTKPKSGPQRQKFEISRSKKNEDSVKLK